MLDHRVVEKMEEAVGQYSVSCKLKNVADQLWWAFTSVYGPNLDNMQHLMWEELVGITSWWDLPWVVGGDFNVVHFPPNRLRAEKFTQAMHNFYAMGY